MKARIIVYYPAGERRIVLRTENDWDVDVEPIEVDADGNVHHFEVESEEHVLRFKPCIYEGEKLIYTPDPDSFVPVGSGIEFTFHPFFFCDGYGKVGELVELESSLDRPHHLRLYIPPGYDENTLATYPVIYMQDGANLFLPEEAFRGQEWQVDATMNLLNEMRLIQPAIVVGIHAQKRMEDYTDDGYDKYGKAVIEEIKPWVDANYRTNPGPEDTIALGSSLGGVVSFFLAWEWPEVFGNAGCMSSTFTFGDNLIQRVRKDPIGPRENLKIYLDSGYPRDNYEVTMAMVSTLLGRGFEMGRDVTHYAFPYGRHSERDWAERCHLPFQFFCGHPRRISRRLRDARNKTALVPTEAPPKPKPKPSRP